MFSASLRYFLACPSPVLLLLALVGSLVTVPVAAIEVVVGGGVERSLPLAVADFVGAGNAELTTVIRNDLRRSGYFYSPMTQGTLSA